MLIYIDIGTDLFMTALLLYLAYRFFVIYRATADRVPEVLFIVFMLVVLAQFISAVWTEFFGLPLYASAVFHQFLFLMAAASLAWAVLPRRGWRQKLKPETESRRVA